jgi:hypothetical protein
MHKTFTQIFERMIEFPGGGFVLRVWDCKQIPTSKKIQIMLAYFFIFTSWVLNKKN